VPTVGMGVGNANSNNHAPNENIVIADYVEGIKHAAWVMHRFAQT
jgi:acetylornithine deacetylase/succinyl-diaminopimelate desuccinylase-like protein